MSEEKIQWRLEKTPQKIQAQESISQILSVFFHFSGIIYALAFYLKKALIWKNIIFKI